MLYWAALALVGAVFYTLLLPLIASSVRAADLTTMALGMHQATNGCCDVAGGLSAWEQTLNRPAGSMYADDFVADKGGWENYDGSAWMAAHDAPQGRRLVLAVGFFPDSCDCTIQKAAAGAYNGHYANVATQLIAHGHRDAIIRVAWEFDGDWYPWGYKRSGLTETTYAAHYQRAFRQLVNTFRKFSATSFTFVWNPTSSAQLHLNSYEATYPGNDYVDCLGLDVYDDAWDSTADPAARWANKVNAPLFRIAQMSSANGKPICFPEWAAGEGGNHAGLAWPNDNPTFVTNMANFMADPTLGGIWPNATVWFNSYWSGDGDSGYSGWINTSDYYPNQRAVYIARFRTPAGPAR